MNFKYLKVPILFILFLAVVISQTCFGENFSSKSSYSVCFSPKDNCAAEIINTIKLAKKQILVQAYIFNDMSIAKAFVEAKRTGVDVKVILDKSQTKKQRKLIDFLIRNQIKVIIANYSPAILHNKIIVIDGAITITGSYNFSYGARRNHENIVLINDSEFTKKYIQNWHECAKEAITK